MNIAILGAGIMGLSCAYRLVYAQTHGCLSGKYKISLYDPKGLSASNASWMAGGMLAPYSEIEHMDARWVEAGLSGISYWENISLDTGFKKNGSLLIAHPEDRHALERFAAHLPVQDYEIKRIPRELESTLPDKFKSGLYLQQEAHLEPRRAISALTEYLKDKITVIKQAAAPETLDANIIIDCRGMGDPQNDLRGVKGEIAIVRNPEFTLMRPVRIMHPRYPLYIVPRPDHIFMIGATVIESDEGDTVSLRSSMELMSALYTLHPSFGEAQILEFSAGIRPSYPDNLPHIKCEDHIIRANGLFRHGFLLAPLMADAIAMHIDGQKHENWDLLTHGKQTDQTGY